MANSNSDQLDLRAVELRLLRTTLPDATTAFQSSCLPPLLESLLSSIEKGDYAGALHSGAAASDESFGFASKWQFEDSTECAESFYRELEGRIRDFVEGLDGEERELQCAILLCIGVAAVLAFTQQNLSGPIGKLSSFPVIIGAIKTNGGNTTGAKWDLWAANQLSSVGSHIQGKLSLLQYLVCAKIIFTSIMNLFTKSSNSSLSISWWQCRVLFLQQRILDELSSSLFDQLESYKRDMLAQFGKSEEVSKYWGDLLLEGEPSTISCMACLEAAMIDYKYGRVDASRKHLDCAKEECKLDLSLTGVLGFRTIHQVNPKAQLVLLANTEDSIEAPINDSGIPREEDESCEILRAPRLVPTEDTDSNGNNVSVENSKNISLKGLQQAVVMGECVQLRRTSRDDEMSGWEKAPYVELIDSQKNSHYAVRCLCDLLRIRWESDRSRTKQRALLMMENLVELVEKPLPEASERIHLAFSVFLPTIPALRKEYSELLISCGLVSEALKILEELELWDNLIDCYRLLGKKAAAVDLIKARLVDKPNDPRLWCSLGDVTTTDSYYEKALEVSNNKSARAMRSLARSAYNRDDFKTAKSLWESALALNSLYPDGWFSLGAAAWKDQDLDKAVDAFTRAVQIDPENGEAWNNIGCLHMKRNKSEAACIAFKEAIKYKRNSWEVWENFSKVAFDSGNLRQALEAIKKVLDLSSYKRIDVLILDKVMCKLEHMLPDTAQSPFGNKCEANKSIHDASNKSESHNNPIDQREIDFLLDLLGTILQQIVKNSPNEGIWSIYARWHRLKGNLTMCSEALLKQLRSLQGSELWHNEEKFKKFAYASLQLCNVYMEIASSTGSRRELSAAQMHLKSTLKQAVDFTETDEFKALSNSLDEIKKRLDAFST
ncbi:hypothetical protein LUZ61_006091 [Rhynchospora tenuis]|uniref:Uncharacterized protein n=1 Tax=Rhynchospora tenuis TaxID=198213 RepID=A0AAD6EV65_9POAL|nr:hypothetical protein LUZ61_006091 [Rhynchospora tenuis]